MTQSYETVVIGAGFAGLSCAAHLVSRGQRDLAVLEQGEGVGGFWRGNYDRIRLHTPYHDLPDDGGLRRHYGLFMRRDQLIDYFEAYARHHRLMPYLRCNTPDGNIQRHDDGWHIDTPDETLRARNLVVATSYNRKPRLPDFEGLRDYGGTAIHSRAYKNARPFRDQHVLVVGSGNSSAEIALDLCKSSARSVAMLIRGPRHFISLAKLGVAARIVKTLRMELTPKHLARTHAYTRTHPGFRDKLKEKDAFFLKFAIDLSDFGIDAPADGPATQISLRGRVPVMDQGTAKAIRKGHIRLIDAKQRPLQRITPQGVLLGEQEEAFDAIIFATGMQPGLDELFADPERYLFWNADMQRKMPYTDGRSRSVVEPSLYFPGFDLSANGGLSLGLWGAEVAAHIARDHTQGSSKQAA